MPDRDKYGPARLDGSSQGFGQPPTPHPRIGSFDSPKGLPQARPAGPSAIKQLSDLTGRVGGNQPIESRPQAPANPAISANPTGVAGLNAAINASSGINPASFQVPQARPTGQSPVERLQEKLASGQGRSNLVGGVPAEFMGGQTDLTLPPKKSAAQVPVGAADITQERGRDIASGAVPGAALTPTEQATVAAGGANAGVQGASEAAPASAATLAPQIVQPVGQGTGQAINQPGAIQPDASQVGAIPEGAIEVIRGAPWGRGQTRRSFASPDAQGNFFESTDPRSSIAQGLVADSVRNPGSVEAAQAQAILDATDPRAAERTASQGAAQLDRSNRVAVQEARGKVATKSTKAPPPDLAAYIASAIEQGQSEEDAIAMYYIEYGIDPTESE